MEEERVGYTAHLDNRMPKMMESYNKPKPTRFAPSRDGFSIPVPPFPWNFSQGTGDSYIILDSYVRQYSQSHERERLVILVRSLGRIPDEIRQQWKMFLDG